MKRTTYVVAGSLIAGLLAAGCSLALGIDENDYARGPAGGANDGGANDAGGATDGGVGDATLGDGGPSPISPCAQAHLFCDDFDDGSTTLSDRGWTPPFVTNGSTVVVDDLDSVSRPRSLSVVATPGGSGMIEREVAVSEPIDLTLAFDIRADMPSEAVALAHISLGSYHARMSLRSTGVVTMDEWDDVSGRVSTARASSTVITARWAHVEITLHFIKNKQAGSRIKLRVDDSTVVDDVASPSVATAALVGFTLGDIDHPPSAVRARFDNVTFDAK